MGIDNYLPKYKQGPQAVIVNISSISSITAMPNIPIYSGTKAAIVQMTRAWGDPHHYTRTKVKVFAICPGTTLTPLLHTFKKSTLGDVYEEWCDNKTDLFPPQE